MQVSSVETLKLASLNECPAAQGSGQKMPNNVNDTHLVLACGKLVQP